MTVKHLKSGGGYHVGEEGEFTVHDAYNQPIETIRGKILNLIEGEKSLYAMIRTDRGVRPARLLNKN
jgi:hypothetical protein